MTNGFTEIQAKARVVEAGVRLFREGMVARTWGNVSLRVDAARFAITPSGIPYERLRPESIVTVNLSDLSYTGSIKPSSEKGLHAAIYRERPDIRAVIHTHQKVASAFSAARKDITGIRGDTAELIGPHVITAAYALPGTKKLARSGALALRESKAALLANHGAVCIGITMDEAFKVCLELENLCRIRVDQAVMASAGTRENEPGLIHRMYLEQTAKGRQNERL